MNAIMFRDIIVIKYVIYMDREHVYIRNMLILAIYMIYMWWVD